MNPDTSSSLGAGPSLSAGLATIRQQFPSLDRPDVFFDNPGGTQIARQSAERIQKYLLECNANHGGAFKSSIESDEVLDEAHQAMADFLNAASADEIVFGPNMTTLTFSLSRALARTLSPGDEILVTRLDHDANIAPWLLAAEDRGCHVTWVDFDVEDCTLSLDDFARALERRPKIAAFGYASNAVGTINPVRKLTGMAHEAGALVFIDAVQYAPHGPIDVQDLGCDFLACSAYKFFGPHVGALYGRYDLLDGLRPYKVRPASDLPPGKFETGTQNHEGIAGVLGALEYLEGLGKQFGAGHAEGLREATPLRLPPNASHLGGEKEGGRRMALKQAMSAIRAYEFELSRALIQTIEAIPGTHIHGITEPKHLDQRVPTVSFTLDGRHPRQVAEMLGKRGIYVWDGNYYALAVTERLGVEVSGGMLRVGAAHYNTLQEVSRLGEALKHVVTT